ncbi:unnamed protein product [Linum trigynum]|uniref:Gag-pol polyprotein n=1 Tax=Linum trigynum TaxID=586398 RepID=A0AAV2EUP1_9ROSI
MNTGKTKATAESIALAALSGQSGQRRETGKDGKKSQKLFCRYCKKDNHLIEDCFKLKNKRKNESGGRSFAGSIDTNGNDGVVSSGGSSQSPSSSISENRTSQEGQSI